MADGPREVTRLIGFRKRNIGSELEPELSERLRVIVAQMGARRNYAVPRMLHSRGALAALYTDVCFHGASGRLATAVARCAGPDLAAKFRRRSVQGVSSALIRSAPDINILSSIRRSHLPQALYAFQDDNFSKRMIRWGVRDANVVYATWGSGSGFWKYAKERGLKIAIDVFITPVYHRILAEELRAFPDWASDEDARTPAAAALQHELIDRHVIDILKMADLLLCPSATVIEGVSAFVASLNAGAPVRPVVEPRAVMVPYGYSIVGAGPSEPRRGRILFAGGGELRKGIHYFAKAAALLRAAGRSYEFRVAGGASARVRNHPEAQALHFLGFLSTEDLSREYCLADVLVLPTLAEGSARVIFEALAAGLPVVTTRSAGSVVTHGREGLIVPERDPQALAKAIEHIVKDREQRATMSQAAKHTAQLYDENCWRDRLLPVLGGLLQRNGKTKLAVAPDVR